MKRMSQSMRSGVEAMLGFTVIRKEFLLAIENRIYLP